MRIGELQFKPGTSLTNPGSGPAGLGTVSSTHFRTSGVSRGSLCFENPFPITGSLRPLIPKASRMPHLVEALPGPPSLCVASPPNLKSSGCRAPPEGRVWAPPCGPAPLLHRVLTRLLIAASSEAPGGRKTGLSQLGCPDASPHTEQAAGAPKASFQAKTALALGKGRSCWSHFCSSLLPKVAPTPRPPSGAGCSTMLLCWGAGWQQTRMSFEPRRPGLISSAAAGTPLDLLGPGSSSSKEIIIYAMEFP